MNKFKITFIATLISFMSHMAYADVSTTTNKDKVDLTKKSASTVKTKKVVKEPITSPMPVEDTPDNADDSALTGSLTLTTNYMNRGVSQSNNVPAVQGSLTYTFTPTGIYFNVWGSNVDQPAPDGSTGTLEIDTLAGISNDIGDHFNYNLAFARYFYPKAEQLNYNEIIGNVGLYFLTAYVAYSANEFNVHKPGIYYNGGVKFELPEMNGYLANMTLAATIGRYDLPKEAGTSYNDYQVTLSKDIKTYTIALQWTDTNHRFLDNSLDSGHLVASVTANF